MVPTIRFSRTVTKLWFLLVKQRAETFTLRLKQRPARALFLSSALHMNPASLPLVPIRWLGLDYGEARIGVAGADALGLLAHPLETVASYPRPEALKRIAALCASRQATGIVLGLPVREDGREGRASETVRAFAEVLRSHLPPGMVLVFQDEYRSTVQAAEHLRASGKKTKSHRPLIDQAAAVVILQDYLDAHQPGPEELGPEGVE